MLTYELRSMAYRLVVDLMPFSSQLDENPGNLGGMTDVGWYLGQCRFSKIAWGRLYRTLRQCISFFYPRDETFECDTETVEPVTVLPAR